jgi:acetyltransferase-like isoleucine patch superfamily enzyme
MGNKYTFFQFLNRLHGDLSDKNERQYYFLWLISQIPCAYGDMLRSQYCAKRFKSSGANLRVQAGTRFRSMEMLEVGDNVTIGFDNFFQALGGLKIGNNVMSGPGVKIWSVNHNYMDANKFISEQGQTKESVVIGNDVWLAANAFITPGVNLPDGCVVYSGAVVPPKSYKPNSLIAGNPGRVIGYRQANISNGTE